MSESVDGPAAFLAPRLERDPKASQSALVAVDMGEAVDRAVDRLTNQDAASRMPLGAPRVPVRLARILVAVDGSGLSSHAVAWAARLARVDDAKLFVMTVAPGSALADVGRARAVAEAAAAEVARAGRECETLVASGGAATEIVRVAEAVGADLVVMGAGRRGFAVRLLGSVADQVKDMTRASVLLVRGPPTTGVVLSPVDGSALSRSAAWLAARIAVRLGGHAMLLHVLAPDDPRFPGPNEAGMRRTEAKFKLETPELPLSYRLSTGRPAEGIRKAVRSSRTDLVIVGSRGLGGLKGLALGSVSAAVARDLHTSVFVVKEPQ